MAASVGEEAGRTAAALIVAVIDGDTEGAQALVCGSSREVLAQAAADLARLAVEGTADPAALRADITALLNRPGRPLLPDPGEAVT